MLDLISIFSTAAVFAITWLYVIVCDRLKETRS